MSDRSHEHEEDQGREQEAQPTDAEMSDDPSTEGEDAEANPVAELLKAEEAMQSLEGERDKLFERLQRVSADYQNYMRRAEQELGRAIGRAQGDLLKHFLPVLDHFDNALASEPTGEEGKALHKGFAIVRDELLKVLKQAGVERLDVAVGEPFDPHRHEALMQQKVEGVEPGHVAASMQPGYVYGERTLRPAKVAVAPN
ncbi:MAG: nucleotide exchange factor GrpE [Phycisphaeraceae bacterium]